MRAAHAVVAAGWLGLTVAMCTLGVSAATTADPAFALAGYRLMERLDNPVIAAFAVATLLTGVLASVTTPWGLFRYRWVVVKELLAIVVIVSAIVVTNGWITLAAAEVARGPGDRPLAWLPVAGSVGQAVLLVAATVLSTAKPWGRTRPTRTP